MSTVPLDPRVVAARAYVEAALCAELRSDNDRVRTRALEVFSTKRRAYLAVAGVAVTIEIDDSDDTTEPTL